MTSVIQLFSDKLFSCLSWCFRGRNLFNFLLLLLRLVVGCLRLVLLYRTMLRKHVNFLPGDDTLVYQIIVDRSGGLRSLGNPVFHALGVYSFFVGHEIVRTKYLMEPAALCGIL